MFHVSTLTIVRSLLPGTNHQRRNQQNKTIYSVSYYFRSLGRQLRDVYESLGGNSRGNGEGNGTPLQYYCLENPMDRGASGNTAHGVEKNWTRLSNFSTLAWKIPWTEDPGRLQSMRLLRVRHDWATSLWLFTFMHRRRKWQPTPVFLPGKSHGQRSLAGYSPWGCKESDMTDRLTLSLSFSLPKTCSAASLLLLFSC